MPKVESTKVTNYAQIDSSNNTIIHTDQLKKDPENFVPTQTQSREF